MKICILSLFLAFASGALQAQQPRNTMTIQPYVTSGAPRKSRFWTPSTIGLVALDGAAKAADSYATRKNIDGGGVEFNPLARPFVHTTGLQISSMAAMLGAEVSAAYVLHRRHHNNLTRGVLASGVIINGLGAAASIKHRVADW